jgi:hypothetical protein
LLPDFDGLIQEDATNCKHQSGDQPEHHYDLAIAKVEVRQRADVEGYNSAEASKRNAPGVRLLPRASDSSKPPRFDGQYRHKTAVKDERGQAPPGGNLDGRRVEVAWGKVAAVIKA